MLAHSRNAVQVRLTPGIRAVNKASLPPLADIVILVLKHIAPDVNTSDIETLKAQAMAEIAESNAAVNADIPPYNTIHTKATTHAMHVFSANANLTDISKVTCMLMQVCVCPGRERMLRCLRACDSDNFKPEEDHSRDVLEAFRAEHECDAACLSTERRSDQIRSACVSATPTLLRGAAALCVCFRVYR